jgi:hypothetical protein
MTDVSSNFVFSCILSRESVIYGRIFLSIGERDSLISFMRLGEEE